MSKPSDRVLAYHAGLRCRKFRKQLEADLQKPIVYRDASGKPCPDTALANAAAQAAKAEMLSYYQEVEKHRE